MSSFLRKLNREVGGVPVNRRDRRAAYIKAVVARKEAFKLINLACFDPAVNDAVTVGAYEEFKSEPLTELSTWYRPELLDLSLFSGRPGKIIGLDETAVFHAPQYKELLTRMRANTVPAVDVSQLATVVTS